jgi:hypothetical protein
MLTLNSKGFTQRAGSTTSFASDRADFTPWSASAAAFGFEILESAISATPKKIKRTSNPRIAANIQ